MRVCGAASIIVISAFACGEFRNAGLLADVVSGQDRQSPPPSCTESETITVYLPEVIEWKQGRPVVEWLYGETRSGSPLFWSASNLPVGVELTDAAGVLGGMPAESGVYTTTLTATSDVCPEVSLTRAVTIEVLLQCANEVCPESPPCAELRIEDTVLDVEYVPALEARRLIGAGEVLAEDHLLVEAVLLNPPNALAERTLVLSVPNSKDTVLVHYTLPGGVYAPVSGQRIDLRYVHGEFGDRYLFLTIDHLKRFTLVHDGVLTRDELQRRCPDNPIGLHCQLPEVDWVPLSCSHPDSESYTTLALETVTAADEGPGVVRRRIGPGAGLVTGGMLLMLVDAVGCGDASCDDSPSPVRATMYEVPSECAVCRIAPFDQSGLLVPVSDLVLRGEVIHPRDATGATFTWTAEPPVSPGVLVRSPLDDDAVRLELPMVGDHTVRLGCTAQSAKANLKSCGPAEVRFSVLARPERPVRVEFWWFVPTVDSDPVSPPQLTFNGDSAQAQGPRFQAVEPSIFGELSIEYAVDNSVDVQAWIRVLVDGEQTMLRSELLSPGAIVPVGSLGPDGLQEVTP